MGQRLGEFGSGGFQGAGDILILDLCGSYMSVFTL